MGYMPHQSRKQRNIEAVPLKRNDPLRQGKPKKRLKRNASVKQIPKPSPTAKVPAPLKAHLPSTRNAPKSVDSSPLSTCSADPEQEALKSASFTHSRTYEGVVEK